jgi:hypothetical protein
MLRRPIAYALLVWSLASCTFWRVESGVSLKELISTEHPKVVRLTETNGSQVVLDQPRIVAGDSVWGFHNGVLSSIAVSDVSQVAIRKVDGGKTTWLALGVIAGLAVVVKVAIHGAQAAGN